MTRTIEQVVGQRIRERREHQGLTQERLGELVGEYLGKPWTRQAVYTAEKGGRDFRAVELSALALVLGVPVGYLTDPMGDDVEFPGGRTVQADEWAWSLYKSSAEWRDEARRNYLLRQQEVLAVIIDMSTRSVEGMAEVFEINQLLLDAMEGDEE